MKHPDCLQVLIAIDQLVNTLFAGMADETLSSRAHRLKIERGRNWPSCIIDSIFFWQKGHCENAYLSELERSHFPISMRGDRVA